MSYDKYTHSVTDKSVLASESVNDEDAAVLGLCRERYLERCLVTGTGREGAMTWIPL